MTKAILQLQNCRKASTPKKRKSAMGLGLGLCCCGGCNPCEIWCVDTWPTAQRIRRRPATEANVGFVSFNRRLYQSPGRLGETLERSRVSINENGKLVFRSVGGELNNFRNQPYSHAPVSGQNHWESDGPWQNSQYADGMQGATPVNKDWHSRAFNSSVARFNYVYSVELIGGFRIGFWEVDEGVAEFRTELSNGIESPVDPIIEIPWLEINTLTIHTVQILPVDLNPESVLSVNGVVIGAASAFAHLSPIEVDEEVTVHRAHAPYLDYGNNEGCEPVRHRQHFVGEGEIIRFGVETERSGSFFNEVDRDARFLPGLNSELRSPPRFPGDTRQGVQQVSGVLSDGRIIETEFHFAMGIGGHVTVTITDRLRSFTPNSSSVSRIVTWTGDMVAADFYSDLPTEKLIIDGSHFRRTSVTRGEIVTGLGRFDVFVPDAELTTPPLTPLTDPFNHPAHGRINYTIELVSNPGRIEYDFSELTIGESLTVAPTFTEEATTTTSDYHTFAITDGELPDGLTINSATGVITGTPTTESNGVIIVTATGDAPTPDEPELRIVGSALWQVDLPRPDES